MSKETLVQKWLTDNLTADEMKQFRQSDEFLSYQKIIDTASQFKATDVSESHDFKTFKQRYANHKKPVRKLNWMRPMLRIASIVVVSLGIYVGFFNNSNIKVETLANQQSTIELPDQSKVTLNALSTIAYNKKNWENKRSLSLEGEAYFEVAKGKTFDVHTSDGTVTVVGTKFNVKQRDNYFEVQCFEGIVKVVSDTIVRHLRKGDSYQILNGVFNEKDIHIENPQWANGSSIFKKIPLINVIAELERQYNITITADGIDTSRLFSGGFIHNNLENALIAITQPMNLTYQQEAANRIVLYEKKN